MEIDIKRQFLSFMNKTLAACGGGFWQELAGVTGYVWVSLYFVWMESSKPYHSVW